MVKKVLRKITASEDVAALIDEGAKVNTEMSNLTYQDKGLKKKISDAAVFEKGEVSLKLEGNTATAMITSSEKITLNFGAKSFKAAEAAIDEGLLEGVVKAGKTLLVPGESLVEAMRILQKAGVSATIKNSYTVNSAAYRGFTDEGSPERAEAKEALDGCIEKSQTLRVKYE